MDLEKAGFIGTHQPPAQTAPFRRGKNGGHFTGDDMMDVVAVHICGQCFQAWVAGNLFQQVEDFQVDRPAVTGKSLFAGRVEEIFEIRHNQFTQAAVDRLTVPPASEI